MNTRRGFLKLTASSLFCVAATESTRTKFPKKVDNAIEAVFAITGVAATAQDERFWAARTFRPHLLPPLQKDIGQGEPVISVGASPCWRTN